MKSIFYGVSILLSLVGAYFAYDNSNKLKAEQAKTEELLDKKKNLITSGVKNEERLVELQQTLAEADKQTAEISASLDSAKGKESSMEKTLTRYEAELQSIDDELEGFTQLKDEIESALGSIDVENVAEIPDLLDKLESDVQDKEDELDDLDLIINKLKAKVKNESVAKQSTVDRLMAIKNNINGNTVGATVTSVNKDWGFVVLNKGADNSPIKEDSELLVHRGGKLVGKLTVATLNAHQTICDIDDNNFHQGLMVRPGDRVILKDPIAR